MRDIDAFRLGYSSGFAEGVAAMQRVIADLSRKDTNFNELVESFGRAIDSSAVDSQAPIGVLSLSRRLTLLLQRNGIKTVGDLLEYGTEDLRELAGFGPRTLDEIEAALSVAGAVLVHGRLRSGT